jgi:hypothetical protein
VEHSIQSQVEPFPVIEVPLDAPDRTEDMGTKVKFWFDESNRGRCLYKKARLNTGEDWAEKIAAELCQLLQLPHAEYDLATYQGEPGIVSPSFLPQNASLVIGNEILFQTLPDYPKNTPEPAQHTINNIFRVIQEKSLQLPIDWKSPATAIQTPADVFVGYLMLDAWIGNTDRHHENWALIRFNGQDYLAPTYDHASSLGRNEPDRKRQQRLLTQDQGFSVRAYVEKCKSCIYDKMTDKTPLKTFDAFVKAGEKYPSAALTWLSLLEQVSSEDIQKLFDRIPKERITSVASQFAQEILRINRDRLLAIRQNL